MSRNLTLLAATVLSLNAGQTFAADLGGACCGDLKDRVAELEATTVRKANRAVSLSISGEVNRALLIWDDGTRSDTYVVDNAAPDEGSKLRVSGEGRLSDDWRSGFIHEPRARHIFPVSSFPFAFHSWMTLSPWP